MSQIEERPKVWGKWGYLVGLPHHSHHLHMENLLGVVTHLGRRSLGIIVTTVGKESWAEIYHRCCKSVFQILRGLDQVRTLAESSWPAVG